MLRTTVIALLMYVVAGTVSAEVTGGDIERAVPDDLQHPYLYFSAEDIPQIRERIATDAECGDIMDRLLAEANRYLYMPVDLDYPKQQPHGHFNAYNDWGVYVRANRKAAHDLAFVYRITGDERYGLKALEFAEALCVLPEWTEPYHQFPVIYTRVWPWGADDDQVVFNFDLWAAATTQALACVYDWTYDIMPKPTRDRIRGALLEKGLLRVRGNYDYYWWASSWRCNWCSVCNAGLGIAALALMTEDPSLVDVAAESYNRIGHMLDEIGDGGGWQEGASYWNYGVREAVMFAEPLKRLTGGEYNLFAHPKIADNTVNCPLFSYIPPNRTVNFEDSGNHIMGPSWLFNKLADETGSHEAAWYRSNLHGAGRDMLDIIWPRTTVSPSLPEHGSHLFPTMNWAVLRSDFTDPEKVLVACKAGYHDDPHHGHLDCGQFIVYWRGEGFIAEMPRLGYDILYFQKERWDNPQAQTAGHNVVIVNGREQLSGKLKDQPWQEGIGGDIVVFEPGEDRDYVVMDPTKAYPGIDLKKWRRHIILDKPSVTVIVDELETVKGAEIETRFHSDVTQQDRDRWVFLDGEKGDMAIVPVVEGDYTIRFGKHTHLAMKRNANIQTVPYCGTVLNADDESTVIATVIIPVESESIADILYESAEGITGDEGSYVLSFSYDGRQHEYRFRRSSDGLRLE